MKFVMILCCVSALLVLGCNPDGEAESGTETETVEPKEYTGVDLLIVVDDSGSMYEEQAILSTGLYSLMNSLVKPTSASGTVPITDIRVAVVNTDLGLQYGDGQAAESPTDIPGCGDVGDDGAFQQIPTSVALVDIGSGVIACDVDGDQCPSGFVCENDGGGYFCNAPTDPYQVNCPSIGDADWTEITENETNGDLTNEVACMAAQGTAGCGIEQTLMAPVRALNSPGQGLGEFIDEDHALAVLVVTDEEDCSIEDPGLFNTDEWVSGPTVNSADPTSGHLNTACNLPVSNEENYLYSIDHFYNALVGLKGNDPSGVLFTAIVGVPENDTCQGAGDEIGDCLSQLEMQLTEALFPYPSPSSAEYYHFWPACTREENGEQVTAARPGRRHVKLAEQFGTNGYVTSICNPNWNPAMELVGKRIAEVVGPI